LLSFQFAVQRIDEWVCQRNLHLVSGVVDTERAAIRKPAAGEWQPQVMNSAGGVGSGER
jgi:hypothetical protein